MLDLSPAGIRRQIAAEVATKNTIEGAIMVLEKLLITVEELDRGRKAAIEGNPDLLPQEAPQQDDSGQDEEGDNVINDVDAS
jgi:hypothetical protein